MASSTLDKEKVNLLLQYDLEKFAEKLGLLSDTVPRLEEELAVSVLNIAERLSRPPISVRSRNMCLLICALVWEHRQEAWVGLPPFLVEVISRLGLLPSTKMVDPYYDSIEEVYNSLGSLISQLKVARRMLDHEVEVGGKILLLSDFQYNMWQSIDKFSRLGVSAPTSAGKSYILVNKVIQLSNDDPGEVVFIVPTITLINQVSADLRKAIRQFGFTGFSVMQTYAHEKKPSSEKNIYVLTQERALSALRQDAESFRNVKILIVDEIQNIERVANEDDERSQDLYHTIQEFEHSIRPDKIIVSGPRVKNIEELVKDLFGDNAECISDSLPPVINITYSFSIENRQTYLNQYSSFQRQPLRVKVQNEIINKKLFGKVQYTEDIYNIISYVSSQLNKGDSGTIVFSPTKDKAAETALYIAKKHPAVFKSDSNTLSEYIAKSVHPNYSLVESVRNGVGYHHSGVPLHVRLALEKAFSKQVIKTMVCTTTLMQGVNLPAKNIIARNPLLGCKMNVAHLTPYEFTNLRGRAGRLMKDFVGRTIIIDETYFDEMAIQMLEPPQKEISAGFGKRFSEDQEAIMAALLKSEEVSNEVTNADIIVYMRQMVLKHGVQNAVKRLHSLDIPVELSDIQEIHDQLKTLTIPRDICLRNVHWDPLALEKIYIACQKKEIAIVPSDIFDRNFVNKLYGALKKIEQIVPYYYWRYFPYDNDKFIFKTLISAQAWGQERALPNIIDHNGKKACSAEDIDKTLQILNSEVAYSIPKLLRPLIQIQDEDNPILGFIEMGGHKEETRRLIELGIPRETSAFISNLMDAQSFKIEEHMPDDELKHYVSRITKNLSPWERVQVEDIIL